MGNCARPSIAPLLFRGVWAAAVIHGAALALDLALGLAVSRRWLNNQLSKATHRALCRFAPSVRCGLVQGAYGPPNPPCSPRSIRPLAVLRGGHFEPGGWPMPTEFDYTITPRALELGGGWNVAFLEDGEAVGGAVYPLPDHVALDDSEAVRIYTEALHEDALAEATAWLASR